MFACGDVCEFDPPLCLASQSRALGSFGAPQSSPSLRNAHLAESQAEVVAHNVRCLMGSSLPLASFPRDAFQSPLCPVLACVSLGPNNAIIVFNNIVIGGLLLGRAAGLIKFIIERSKVSEIRHELWGRALWAFVHVVVNAVHRATVWWSGLRRGTHDGAAKATAGRASNSIAS